MVSCPSIRFYKLTE